MYVRCVASGVVGCSISCLQFIGEMNTIVLHTTWEVGIGSPALMVVPLSLVFLRRSSGTACVRSS
jgi:hypothetical protein